jgi:hypothetical protein
VRHDLGELDTRKIRAENNHSIIMTVINVACQDNSWEIILPLETGVLMHIDTDDVSVARVLEADHLGAASRRIVPNDCRESVARAP